MAPTKDFEVLEKSAESGSNDTTSNAGSSAELKEPNDNSTSSSNRDYHRFTTSSPAILEPSEDDPLFKREKIRRPMKTYNAIMKSFNSREIYVNSDEPSNDGENGQQMGRLHSVCIDLFNRYRNFAIKFRNSRLIYVVQILLILLPLSALGIAFKYARECPGSPGLMAMSVISGTFALILISQWMAIKYCNPDDRPCEDYQKFSIFALFLLVSLFLGLEILHFFKMSPSFEPSASNYCSKIFYDYTYYKFIAAVVSMWLVVLLYFPDYRSFAADVTCTNPMSGSCYEGMLEESE